MSTSEIDASLNKVLVARADGQRNRVQGATDWWFYPLLLACAAAIVFLSLGAVVFRHKAVAQRGAEVRSALVYGPRELANGVRVDDAQVLYIPRDFGFVPKELHLAVRPNRAAPRETEAGAQLLLDPAQSAALLGKPVLARVSFGRIPITPATALALSLENGGANAWQTATFPPEGDVVEIRLPPVKGSAPTALGIRMIAQNADLNYGAAITRIELRPAP